MLKIRCKPIFFDFFYSYQRKQFFRLVKADFLLRLPLLRANVVLVEIIIQIKVKPFFIE